MARFAKHILDKFLAPYVSNFRSAEIPDLSDESSSWLSKYFLNSVLRGSYADPFRQYVFNFLRRVEGAHVAHQCARSATAEFLHGSRQSMSRYMEAIFHWEAFLAQSWMAYALSERVNETRPFEGSDGSVEQRVNLLHNRSKHSDTAIEAGQLPPDGTIPVWMEDDGLHGIDVMLSWEETSEVLRDLSNFANMLEDPITTAKKVREVNRDT